MAVAMIKGVYVLLYPVQAQGQGSKIRHCYARLLSTK